MSTPSKLPRDLHRDTLQACLRILGRAEDLPQAMTLLTRMLNGYDKAKSRGLASDVALRLAAERTAGNPVPKSNRADAVPIRLADRVLRSNP
jgi:hypothetical protein